MASAVKGTSSETKGKTGVKSDTPSGADKSGQRGGKNDDTASSSPSLSLGFFKDSVDEMKKITAPTRQETVQATLVTILLVAFMAAALFLMDVVFHGVMSTVVAR